MKKTILLIIVIILNFTCFGQQPIVLTDSISVDLPVKAVRINKDEALSHSVDKFKNDKRLPHSVATSRSKHMYKVDDILVALFTDDHQTKDGRLLVMKKGLDAYFSEDKSYSSSIEKINNIPILIESYTVGNTWVYRFFAFNSNNSKAITGILEFKITDLAKGKDILDHILSSIKFKDR